MKPNFSRDIFISSVISLPYLLPESTVDWLMIASEAFTYLPGIIRLGLVALLIILLIPSIWISSKIYKFFKDRPWTWSLVGLIVSVFLNYVAFQIYKPMAYMCICLIGGIIVIYLVDYHNRTNWKNV